MREAGLSRNTHFSVSLSVLPRAISQMDVFCKQRSVANQLGAYMLQALSPSGEVQEAHCPVRGIAEAAGSQPG
jgi:hypothetical protein